MLGHGFICGNIAFEKIAKMSALVELVLKTASLRLETLAGLKRVEMDAFQERTRANFGDQIKLYSSKDQVFAAFCLYLSRAHNFYQSAIFTLNADRYEPTYVHFPHGNSNVLKRILKVKKHIYLPNDKAKGLLKKIDLQYTNDDQPYHQLDQEALSHFSFKKRDKALRAKIKTFISTHHSSHAQMVLAIKFNDHGFILTTLDPSLKEQTQFQYLKLVLETTANKLRELELVKERNLSIKREKFKTAFNKRLNTSNSIRNMFLHLSHLMSKYTTLYFLLEIHSKDMILIDMYVKHTLSKTEPTRTSTPRIYIQAALEFFSKKKVSAIEKSHPLLQYLLTKYLDKQDVRGLADIFYCFPVGEFQLVFLTKSEMLEDNLIHEIFAGMNLKFAILTSEKAIQNLHVQEEKAKILGRTSWAMGHKLNNLLLQLKSSYAMKNDLRSIFQEIGFQVRSLIDQTQDRSVPAKTIDLNEFVRTTCTIAFYNDQEISLKYHLAPSKPFVHIKAAVLRDMINNLTNNALRHGKADNLFIGTIDLEEKSSILKVPACQIEISDNGTGVPDEILKRGLGVQGNTSHPEGTGMGLYQVLSDLKHIGGHFQYIRDRNLSRFLITLPKLDEAQKKKKLAPLSAKEIENKSILIIDDASANRMIFKNFLFSLGFKENQLMMTASAESAIEYLKKTDHVPNAVICDLYMKKKSGLEFYQWIQEKFSKIYFCLISGNQENTEIHNERIKNPKTLAFIQKGIEGLDHLEQFIISAIRDNPISQKKQQPFKAKGKPSNKDPQDLFWEGFTHRMNNILLLPMSYCEFILDFKNEEFKKRFNAKEVQRFLALFEGLEEISKLTHFNQYLFYHLELNAMVEGNVPYSTKAVKTIYEKILSLQQKLFLRMASRNCGRLLMKFCFL